MPIRLLAGSSGSDLLATLYCLVGPSKNLCKVSC